MDAMSSGGGEGGVEGPPGEPNPPPKEPPKVRDTLDIVPQELSIEESKSRVAMRFLLKKSERFCGAIRFYLSKPATPNSIKLKSLMSSLKNKFRSTLAGSVPSSSTLTQITTSLVSTLKGQRLPECLRFLGFSLTSLSKRRNKCKEKRAAAGLNIPPSGTFLNPQRKPELEQTLAFQFAKPKIYECSYCETRFYKLPFYLKHLRRHAEIIRCESCGKAFSSLVNKRRHKIQCSKRAVL